MNPETAQADSGPDPDRSRAIDRVIEQAHAARLAGEKLDDQTIISSHPELMPQLGRELEKLGRIEKAWSATTVDSLRGEQVRAPASVGPAELDLARAMAADLERPSIEVPGYTVLRELGRGGQAVVFLAFKLNPGRRVALKVMRDGSLAEDRALARFKLEAEVLAELNHPNIVTIFETGLTADGSHYFAMNYIDGCGLDEYMLRRHKSDPDPSRLLRLFHRICSIVHAAHVKQIVHRDLKPGNIRIDERGEPHILDFGLARPVIDRTAGASPVSITGEFLGSLPWSSPEQAAGDPRKIDVRSDVYSLGVILYQMLTGGRFPYEVVGNIRDVLNNIVSTQPTPPSKVIAAGAAGEPSHPHQMLKTHLPAVNEAIEKIVLKALAKQPDDRYQNAGELGRAVANYLLGKITSSQEKNGRKPMRRVLRRRVAVGAACALVGLTLLQTIPPSESPMKPSRLLKGLVLLVTTGAFGGPKPADHPLPIAGIAVPDSATQAKKEKLVRDVFGNYIAAPLGDRPAIAAKMIEQGMASADDPAARFVLLKDGGELAASAGDATTAVRAATLIAGVYAIDGNELKLALLRRAVTAATTPTLAAADAQEGLNCANDAASAGNYDFASRFMLPAEQAARASKEINLILAVQSRAADIKWLQAESSHARLAEDKLNKTPADPDANHTLGRYFCLVRGDWARGLIGLSKGANGTYRTAALADLALPATTDKQVAAGDLWWNLAEKETAGAAQRALRRRAGYWYSQALANPQFAGLARAVVEKKLSQIPPPGAGEAVASVPPAAAGQPNLASTPAQQQGPAQGQPGGPSASAKDRLSAQQWSIASGLSFSDFSIPIDRQWTYTKGRIVVDNRSAVGQIKNKVRARVRILCINGDGKPRVLEYFNDVKIATKGKQEVFFSGMGNEEVKFNNAGDWKPHNAHVLIEFDGVEIYDALWKPSAQTGGWRGEMPGETPVSNRQSPPVATPPVASSTDFAPLTNSIGMKLVRIPAGEFEMGSPPTEAHRFDSEVLHHVKITKPFMMAATTVTQGQWKAVMGSNPSYYRAGPEGSTTPRDKNLTTDDDNLPVEQVSWNDAVAFCEKLSAREAKHYRLPTEAEWEYACRAGTQTPFGDGTLDEVAWYAANSDKRPHDVAMKKPNRWGLYDMIGNVWQWCSDGYGPYGGNAVDPQGSADTSFRVNRGGSCVFDPSNCRAAMRRKFAPVNRNSDVAFRVCLDASQPAGAPASAISSNPPVNARKDILLFIGNRSEEALFRAVPGENVRVIEDAQIADVLAKPESFAAANLIVFGHDALSKAPESAFTDAARENLRAFVENGGNLVVFAQADRTNWMMIQKPFGVHQHQNPPFSGAALRAYDLDAKIRAAGLTKDILAKMQFETAFDIPAIKGIKMYFSSIDGGGAYVVARLPYGDGQLLMIGTSADPVNEPLERFIIHHLFGTGVSGAGAPRSALPAADPVFLSDSPNAKIYPGQAPLSRGSATVHNIEVAHAVGIHPRSTQNAGAKYAIDGRYNQFRASVGFSDAVKSKVKVKFVVRGDGKTLWESEALSGTQQAPTACVVDITGIRELEIGVDPTNDLREIEALWIDPQLCNEANPSPGRSAAQNPAAPPATPGRVSTPAKPASAPPSGGNIFTDEPTKPPAK